MIYENRHLLNFRLRLTSGSRAGSVVYVVSTCTYRYFIHSNSVSPPLIALNSVNLVYF